MNGPKKLVYLCMADFVRGKLYYCKFTKKMKNCKCSTCVPIYKTIYLHVT